MRRFTFSVLLGIPISIFLLSHNVHLPFTLKKMCEWSLHLLMKPAFEISWIFSGLLVVISQMIFMGKDVRWVLSKCAKYLELDKRTCKHCKTCLYIMWVYMIYNIFNFDLSTWNEYISHHHHSVMYGKFSVALTSLTRGKKY